MPYSVLPYPRRPVSLGLMSIAFVAASSATDKPYKAKEAPAEVVSWVQVHALPFATVEAGNGFADLEPLRASIGDARIVALGETTHGSREVFQMKHRLIEFLASKMGFTLFAIEANMPEAQRLDAYVRGGGGNVDDLIRGMHFWTWSTEEVRDLVEWMRRFNADPANRASGRQIGFTGFDMQSPDLPAATARQFIADYAPADLAQLDPAVAAVRTRTPGPDVGGAFGELPPDLVAGKRVTFSAWIRTEKLVDGWAGLSWGASTTDKRSVVFENMQATGPRGTTPWRRYEISTTFPADVAHIGFGLLMPGMGQAWFDDLELTINGQPYDRPDKFSFDFEGGEIVGFNTVNRNSYTVELTSEAHRGKHALHIASCAHPEPAVAPAQALEQWRNVEARIRAVPITSEGDAAGKARIWAAQNAHLVIQALEERLGRVRRDTAMAENVAWLAEQNPDAKIILWAHNGHVARRIDAMGGYLSNRFGDALCVVGFATGRGTYRAFAKNGSGLEVFPLAEPVAGSIESVFARTAQPRLALDLRPSRLTAVGPAAWFAAEQPHRLIGAGEMTKQFTKRSVGRDYDLLIWIDETHASRPLVSAQR